MLNLVLSVILSVHLFIDSSHPRQHWTSFSLQYCLWLSSSWRHIMMPQSQVMLAFGQIWLCAWVSLLFTQFWHWAHFSSISWHSTVTCCWISDSGTSLLQALQVAFTPASNCSANIFRQNPILGSLHMWQFSEAFCSSLSAQCPQTAWPHGLQILGFTKGYALNEE